MCSKALLTLICVAILLAFSACAERLSSPQEKTEAGIAIAKTDLVLASTDIAIPKTDIAIPKSYYVEITISGRRLTVFEISGNAGRVPVAKYTVGTVAIGLDTYPLGLGKVTEINIDPWWYPTPYTRQVFRERGIELPAAVPPGDPRNYMGQVKIALSHKTWKGAIYRIHGNNNPKRVGRRVTGGCFVMNNEDGLALARMIKVGTKVNILP